MIREISGYCRIVLSILLAGGLAGCNRFRDSKNGITSYPEGRGVRERADLIQAQLNRYEARTGEHHIALGLAILHNDSELFDFLLDQPVDLNERDYRGETALTFAIVKNDTSLVRRLLVAGANPGAARENPLVLACMLDSGQGNLEIIRLLIEHGAEVSPPSGQMSPLMASRNVHLSQLLIDSGADVNARNHNGYTALMTVIGGASLEMVHLLVENGADVNRRDNGGRTALDIAMATQRPTSILEYLRSQGAKGGTVVTGGGL